MKNSSLVRVSKEKQKDASEFVGYDRPFPSLAQFANSAFADYVGKLEKQLERSN